MKTLKESRVEEGKEAILVQSKWNMMECDGLVKKYRQVSKDESKKSEEVDGRKRLQRQVESVG